MRDARQACHGGRRRAGWLSVVLLFVVGLVAMVALAASSSRTAGDPARGRHVFVTSGCGSCHTFLAARSRGAIGSDFDRSLKADAKAAGKSLATFVRERIVSGAGIMPAFGGKLTAQELDDLVAFIVGNVGKRPAGIPDLASMCLRLRDLPGSRVVSQAYVSDSASVASYEREFVGGRIGTSRLHGANCTVDLGKNLATAKRTFRSLKATLTGPRPRLERLLRQSAQEELGGSARLISLHVTRQQNLGAGDDGIEIGVTVRASGTRLGNGLISADISFVFVRVGRALGSLSLLSTPNIRIAAAAVVPAATVFAKRIRKALAAR
jgi:cytochrome c6